MTKYEYIADKIEKQILNLQYQQSDKLPSIEVIMKTYQCSRWTAVKAYDLLQKKHFIYSKSKSGFYVAENPIKPQISDHGYHLDTGNPIVSASSLIDAKHCLSIAIEQYSQSSLNLSLKGVESLQEILSSFLSELGIYTHKNNIYLVQGITQILSFLSTTQFPNQHEYILIEEPTYSYYVQFLKSTNIPVLTISRDEKGIDLEQLKHIFHTYKIKFFYTIPRNHNPLGTILNTETRKKIAELAIKYNVYIIEDDYFGHCYKSPKYLPIYYYMAGKNCIYLTSFTKTLPYIRIGICVINNQFQNIFEQLTQQAYYYSYQLPSLISQATLESYLRSSLYQKQVQRIQKQLKKHYHIIQTTTKSWDHSLASLIGGYSGYYATIKINPMISLELLQEKLRVYSLFISTNERSFFDPTHFNHTIRLGIAQVTPSQLKEALTIFYQVLTTLYNESLSQMNNNS